MPTEVNSFFTNLKQDFPDYLRDESRLTGNADSISFPETEEDIKQHCLLARKMNRSITVQGSRTGITGGAVPRGGHVINLSRMNKILGWRKDESVDVLFITAQPGVLFSQIQEFLKTKELIAAGKYFLPPDITETSASVGGMVACNASGAGSFCYGPIRKYVERMRIVLSDSQVLELWRGKQKVENCNFNIKTESGRTIAGSLSCYELPRVKNASGYYVKENMDMLDLFIGSEGTLGVVSEIELRLIPLPKIQRLVVVFFLSENNAIAFVKRIRGSKHKPVAIEFFNRQGLELFKKYKSRNSAFQEIPDVPSKYNAAIYMEFHGQSEDELDDVLNIIPEFMREFGEDADAIWLGCNERDIMRLKNFRHAIPESVNMLIDERRLKVPELTKLGTDMAVPDEELEKMMAMYNKDLVGSGLEYVIFGHIGDNHLHVNIIANNLQEYEKAKDLYIQWARAVVKIGGTISAEHGIGKLKTHLLKEMYGEENIQKMRQIKKLFDFDGVLNPGNLF
jgi:D-lactate dehydrogenase (cytochrome)